jgi:tRNA pseudouridine32 synthase / 23S rRNA pseudouridine746 synthase
VIRVLLEDEHLLAVDKPAGRVVVPGRGPPEESLRAELERTHGPLWVVHRLDRGTSGVLLLARTAAAHRALNVAFERGEPRKRYLALVRGEPPPEAVLDVALVPARRGRMRPARPGELRAKAARTIVRRLELWPAVEGRGPLALVEALPQTGRTHQIRVHLAAAGTPLAIDPDYGDAGPLALPGGVVLARTPLHASRLAFQHPASGAPLEVEAPLAEDLAAAVAGLRRGDGGEG